MTCLLGLNSLICAEEPSTIIYELDFNDCDSFKLQGAVMSVNPGNKTITVAEKEIRLMDVASNDQRLKTVLMNIDGKPEKMESFKVGQVVQVEDFEHPDGFVATSKIQKMNALQEAGKASKSGLQQTKQNAEPKSSGSLSAHNRAFRLGTSPLRSASLKAGL